MRDHSKIVKLYSAHKVALMSRLCLAISIGYTKFSMFETILPLYLLSSRGESKLAVSSTPSVP